MKAYNIERNIKMQKENLEHRSNVRKQKESLEHGKKYQKEEGKFRTQKGILEC